MNDTSPQKSAKTTHTITIRFAEPNSWSYDIDPPQKNPKKAKVKRKDVVQWTCAQGKWKVFFKQQTPLADAHGNPQKEVSGESSAVNGAAVVEKVKDDEAFSYGVTLTLDGSNEKREDDPEIVIEA